MRDIERMLPPGDGSSAINFSLSEQPPGSHVPFPLSLDFIGTYFWNVVGGDQAVRIKKEYYKALLDQEIAWYD
jgi:hypothetical protein